MDPAKIRAWWSHRQALDGRLQDKSPAEILKQTGWARSVGGVGPYLTLFARGGLWREAVDAAVADLEIHELPSARGCAYVVPASGFALALRVGQKFAEVEMKTARNFGVTDAEIDKLCDAVVGALAARPLDTDELREAAGRSVRNLGPRAAAKGMTTTLPLALGRLQATGEIRRVPIHGRLDQHSYRYTLWRPNPLNCFPLSHERAYSELALWFFHWIGPATLAEFQWFSGLGVKAAKAAIEPIALTPLEPGEACLMLLEDREELRSFRAPRQPQYVLVSNLDGIAMLRRDVRGLLAPGDLSRTVVVKNGLLPAARLTDLPSHAILDRGRLIGLWEYDVETKSIVWKTFVRSNPALEAAVKRTETYIRNDLGDARSFSLDNPTSRRARIEALRHQL